MGEKMPPKTGIEQGAAKNTSSSPRPGVASRGNPSEHCARDQGLVLCLSVIVGETSGMHTRTSRAPAVRLGTCFLIPSVLSPIPRATDGRNGDARGRSGCEEGEGEGVGEREWVRGVPVCGPLGPAGGQVCRALGSAGG